MNTPLQASFGNIDIYLFDQLLKGRFDNCEKVLDVGCGGGRNIVYFLKNDFDVFGIDMDANAIESVRNMAREMSPGSGSENFVVAKAEDIPFGDATFDLVICSAVLHFAKNKANFEEMLRSAWRVLKPGGFFFARLASNIGMETLVKLSANGRYLLPDGTTRYLVTHDALIHYTRDLKGELYEPIKTTVVDNLRAMTTWCMTKK